MTTLRRRARQFEEMWAVFDEEIVRNRSRREGKPFKLSKAAQERIREEKEAAQATEARTRERLTKQVARDRSRVPWCRPVRTEPGGGTMGVKEAMMIEHADDSEWTDDELRLLLARAAKENGWDEPGMEAYDRYDDEFPRSREHLQRSRHSP